MIKRVISLLAVCVLTTGCATKVLKVTAPTVKQAEPVIAIVKIDGVKDSRKFQIDPREPETPSIEGNFINDKKITDKAVGRMRHGTFHNALWNFTLKDNETIYSVSERIAANSLTAAGYRVVTKESPDYATAKPVSVDVVQFWAWMQPKFNIDLHFDGELILKSKDNSIVASAKGTKFTSTGFAGGGAWTSLIDEGVADLQTNLTNELKKKAK